MFLAIGLALFNGALLFVVYLALEPWVRRTWPDVLITSTRLLSGRLADPRVGRDLLMGVAIGVLFTLLHFGYILLPATVGRPEPLPPTLDAMGLLGFSSFVGSALVRVVWALQNGLIAVLVFAVIRGGLALIPAMSSRRVLDGVSAVVAAVLFTIVSSRGAQLDTGYFWYQLAYQGLTLLVTMTIILRFGLFATVVVFYISALTGDFPLTLDGSRLYASQAWLLLVVVAAAAVAGLWLGAGRRRNDAGQQTRRPRRIDWRMMLRTRAVVTGLVLALPTAALVTYGIERLRANDLRVTLDRVVRSQINDQVRERCESDPNWFLTGPLRAGPAKANSIRTAISWFRDRRPPISPSNCSPTTRRSADRARRRRDSRRTFAERSVPHREA